VASVDAYNRGTKYLNAKNYLKALQFLRQEPTDFKEKFLNMGNAYRGLGRIDEAAAAYLRAADVGTPSFTGQYGEYPLALNNLGLIAHRRGDDLVAMKFYDRVLQLDPGHVDCIWNRSVAMLRMGCSGLDIDWNEAWTMYEYRFQKGTSIDKCLRWMGGECSEVTVLAEQGYGDKFMFYRYLWAVRDECRGDVFVQCPPDMWDFVRGLGFEPTTEVRGYGIPVCSLAWKYGIIDGQYLDNWEGGSGIGVVWAGSKTHANNELRSCAPGYFRGLRDFDSVVSLNFGHSLGRDIKCVVGESWESKISVLRKLKLVVTVDTAIVHLCGTMGVPCLMIQPLGETDFRWGNSLYKENKFDNVWYRSVSVVDNPGWEKAWVGVMEMVGEFYAG
jgi:hypothetical protein